MNETTWEGTTLGIGSPRQTGEQRNVSIPTTFPHKLQIVSCTHDFLGPSGGGILHGDGRVGQALGMIFRVPDPLVFKGPCLESTSCRVCQPQRARGLEVAGTPSVAPRDR